MNTKYFLLIACIVACFTSCRQTVSPTESHQVETILELFDSLTARSEYTVRYLECKNDSILSEQYSISITEADTTRKADPSDDGHYERWIKKMARDYTFLQQNATRLMDELSQKAEKSYRYISGDTIDYNITMGGTPEVLISMSRQRSEYDNRRYLVLVYTINKPIKQASSCDNVTPVKTVMKEFVDGWKEVKRYPVKYEWDKGEKIDLYTHASYAGYPDSIMRKFHGLFSLVGEGADALAPSSVTGTHYFIPCNEEECATMMDDLYDRLNKLAVENPIVGSSLKTPANIRLSMNGDPDLIINSPKLVFTIKNEETRRTNCLILVKNMESGVHILELYPGDAPRFTIPNLWMYVKQTHNKLAEPEKDFYHEGRFPI